MTRARESKTCSVDLVRPEPSSDPIHFLKNLLESDLTEWENCPITSYSSRNEVRGLLSTELTERKDEISRGGNQCSTRSFSRLGWVGARA